MIRALHRDLDGDLNDSPGTAEEAAAAAAAAEAEKAAGGSRRT